MSKSGKVYITRHVIFDEFSFPYQNKFIVKSAAESFIPTPLRCIPIVTASVPISSAHSPADCDNAQPASNTTVLPTVVPTVTSQLRTALPSTDSIDRDVNTNSHFNSTTDPPIELCTTLLFGLYLSAPEQSVIIPWLLEQKMASLNPRLT